MQIEYKKEWMDTYLCILPDNRMEESFEEKMIQYNPGGGRLEFSRQQKDGVFMLSFPSESIRSG